MSKEQITLEYIINSSPGILFSRLSTPSGLSEWFADDVDQDQQSFIFKWLDDQQVALELHRKENKMIRFIWEDDNEEDTYFEFFINTDELTGSSALIVTDFCEADERQQTIELWNKQIDLLKHGLGTL